VEEPLDPTKARRRIRAIVKTGELRYSGHALKEMKNDQLTTVDCCNVLGGSDGADVLRDRLPLRAVAGRGHRLEGMTMRCMVCGTPMKAGRENFKYNACGLPYVTLVNVEVSRCPKCGEFEVAIPRSEELHRVIAHAVARKPGRLGASEIRFLRKSLGWSGADFAAHMGVSPETVSRWEGEAQRMGGTADRLLRLMIASREPARDYSLDLLQQVGAKKAAGFRLGLKVARTGWQAVA